MGEQWEFRDLMNLTKLKLWLVILVWWTPQLGQRRGQVKRDSRWKV